MPPICIPWVPIPVPTDDKNWEHVMPKITKRTVDAMVPREREHVLWDDEIKGFGRPRPTLGPQDLHRQVPRPATAPLRSPSAPTEPSRRRRQGPGPPRSSPPPARQGPVGPRPVGREGADRGTARQALSRRVRPRPLQAQHRAAIPQDGRRLHPSPARQAQGSRTSGGSTSRPCITTCARPRRRQTAFSPPCRACSLWPRSGA